MDKEIVNEFKSEWKEEDREAVTQVLITDNIDNTLDINALEELNSKEIKDENEKNDTKPDQKNEHCESDTDDILDINVLQELNSKEIENKNPINDTKPDETNENSLPDSDDILDINVLQELNLREIKNKNLINDTKPDETNENNLPGTDDILDVNALEELNSKEIKSKNVINDTKPDRTNEHSLPENVVNEMMLEWNGETSTDGEKFVQKTQHTIDDENGPTDDHMRVLNEYFGHTDFRPMQWSIISSIIHEKQDNCSIMATGYGKSLCYQFPPVYLNGVAIVISPLISLMQDQVLALTEAGIPACYLGSANKNSAETERQIFENRYRLVYITPEFVDGSGQPLIRKMREKLKIVLVAVDEAHCVSFWGHDFRFTYRKLQVIKEMLPEVPILAVTATATTKVRDDIINSLKLITPLLTCSGFNRPNLYFAVFKKSFMNVCDDFNTHVMEYKDNKWTFLGPTIIYCLKKKEAEDISYKLNKRGANTLPYHAGLDLDLRKSTHMSFLKNRVECIVATIAYGMGIDKPDVRNVVHYGTSSSIEGYYQEVGRAGRDGRPARCVCFYSQEDFDLHRYLVKVSGGNEGKKEKQLLCQEKYLITRECRRNYILRHFNDDEVPANQPNCCDNCDKMIARKLNDLNFTQNLNHTKPNELPKRTKRSSTEEIYEETFETSRRSRFNNHILNMMFPEQRRRRKLVIEVKIDV
ncbi:unnamed protein product [Brassicogethes aeneus]|uniref:ATP-dependent DNA helicase n=1 Tax=Brassicogethes aeneus TaxID=1431903 RepID=A0A9P0AW86_BRAAE|nr:unnamed protein product [Brassicogethes aeneus]